MEARAIEPRLVGGRYEVLRAIGAGGMADVYEAVHVASQRHVALKLLRGSGDVVQQAQKALLFEQEFMTLAQVSHPRIVAAYDFGIDAEQGSFYAMELLDGGDLQQRTPLAYGAACSVARDVCSALALLHSRRLLYRDLSPRNVRCTASGAAKLIDFGALTPMGIPLQVIGTPPFVAPEVLQRQPLDARTDLFSLGATLYYALTGRHAFPAHSMAQLWELWRVTPPAPGSLVAGIPEPLDRLVMQLINLEPAQRPSSAAEVMQRLEALADLPANDQLLVQQAYLATPKLVARDEELREAGGALSAAINGSATGVLVLGDAGIGRSRFLEECALRAKVQGVTTLQVAPAEHDDGDYALMRALATALLQAVPEAASEIPEKERGVLAKLLPELLSDTPSDTALIALASNARHERIQLAACAWFVAVSRKRPLCMVVDDTRRADPASIALLRQLLRNHPDTRLHLLWSLTSAERAASDLPSALLLLERASEVITLKPLDSAGIEELLSCVVGDDVPHLAQLAQYVERTAAGNPRDSLLLFQHLVTEGIVSHERGTWNLPAQPQLLALPSSMVQAIAQRVAKLNPSARLLAAAFGCEPSERFSLEESCLLAGEGNEANAVPDLLRSVEAGVIAKSDGSYRLAQVGFEAVLTSSVSAQELAAQHRRLAHVFELRDDAVRRAKHLLAAGDHEQGLDLLLDAADKSKRRTDKDMRLYFDEMRRLPADWLALYQEAMRLCVEQKRPARDREMLLSRLAGFMPIAHAAKGSEGFAVLREHLDQLVVQIGLDLYAQLPDSVEPGTRIATAMARAKQRFDDSPSELRVYEPARAIGPLATAILSALGLITVTNDVEACRQLPSLTPLLPLAPALWIVQKTIDGLCARIEGRFEAALEIYEVVLEHLQRPDRAGLRPTEHTSTTLRVSLSAGTVEACMGRPSAVKHANLVIADPDFQTQGYMLRHLCELWQGNMRAAERTKRLVEHQLAFARTRNNYDGQYLLGQITALTLLDDLTALSHLTASAKRLAALHPSWVAIVHFCQGELERARGAPQAALASLEKALSLIGAPNNHLLWANIAAAHVRVLSELGRTEQAIERGTEYLQAAEAHDLGYLANYISIPLSQALSRTNPDAARAMADLALAGFRAVGSRGLNLVLALENRARIALDTEGPAAFEVYAAESSAENELLSRRLRRAHRKGRVEAVADNAPSRSGEMLSELKSVLLNNTELESCVLRVVDLLIRRAAARGGVLYVRRSEQLKRMAYDGQLPHLDALDGWARAYVEAQVMAQHASTSVLDDVKDAGPPAHGVPAGMYVPIMLGHDAGDGFVYTGLLVLCMPRYELNWLTTVADQLSRALVNTSGETHALSR